MCIKGTTEEVRENLRIPYRGDRRYFSPKADQYRLEEVSASSNVKPMMQDVKEHEKSRKHGIQKKHNNFPVAKLKEMEISNLPSKNSKQFFKKVMSYRNTKIIQ